MKNLSGYPAIARWLGPWLAQLDRLGSDDDYRVILSEVEDRQAHKETLARLDAHVDEASEKCSNFDRLLAEKRKLPSDLEEANKLIMNKLSEIRAVIGLARLGFDDIEFSGTPDFGATKEGEKAAIEVTRLGRSLGKRSDVWDYEAGGRDLESLEEVGYHMGVMSSGGKVQDALSEAIYREIEEKYSQIREAEAADVLMIWISFGRDYLTCGRYELPGVGSLVQMRRTISQIVASAVKSHRDAGLCELLTHVAVSRGRDLDDLLLEFRNHP